MDVATVGQAPCLGQAHREPDGAGGALRRVRLAPEKPFPRGFEDCLACYGSLRAETSGQVAIGGDSSGGNLALAVALHCAEHRRRGPDKVVALSPATDMHFEKYPAFERLGRDN